mgnify:CR=1 FL=1
MANTLYNIEREFKDVQRTSNKQQIIITGKELNKKPIVISFECNEIIMEQMKKNICKIKMKDGSQGTGFFCKIPFPTREKLLTVLITNNHIINQDLLQKENENVSLMVKNEKKVKTINLNNRMKYTNEEYDITIIEIKEEDNINNYLELDDIIINDILNNENYNKEYKNKTIYIIQYPENKLSVSYGLLDNIYEDRKYNFNHKCCTKGGSSGSPVLNLKNKVTIRFLRKEKSSMPDLSLPKINSKIDIDDIGLYGIALSCDKRFLYYTPVKSDKLYKINTLYLQDERTLRNKDINILNKKYSSFEIMSSARGLFYYTSIEENSVLVNFYERILSFNNVRSVSHGKLFDDNVPVSLTFNGTTGYLFYLVNRHHIFINDNIEKELDINQDNFFIYKVKTNDRSYLYPCNIYSYIPNSTWIAIIIISLMLSYGVFKLIVFVTKLSPKKKEMEMNEEELAYINDEEN